MIRRSRPRLVTLAFTGLLAVSAPAARANDSSAALGLGGLVLQQNDDISLDSEELIISSKRVTVRYRFTNHSERDIDTLVAFPLPAVPDDITVYMGDRGMPDWHNLDFVTTVDGVRAPLQRVDTATVAGRPVEERLRQLNWPLFWFQDQDFLQSLAALSDAERAALVEEGLLSRVEHWPGGVRPAWTVRTNVTRQQVFPAGRTVSVEHSYVPVTGSSIAGTLESDSAYRREALPAYTREFCVDDAFIDALDRTHQERARASKDGWTGHVEVFVSYVLTSGANWRGPIRDFRLVIEKDDPATMMSVCMPSSGRAISPSAVEYRLTDFEPDRDLNILYVVWAPSP